MMEKKQIFTFAILIILINVPFNLDIDGAKHIPGSGPNENTAIVNNEFLITSENEGLDIPGSSDWPPYKSDNRNKRVIIRLEREPTSLIKNRLYRSGVVSDEVSMKLTEHYEQLKLDHVKFKTRLDLAGVEHQVLWDYYNALNGIGLVVKERDVNRLRSIPGVIDVAFDILGSGAVSDTVSLVGADSVWGMKNATNASINGEGVVVAVVDTGIDYNHKDLGSGFGPAKKIIGGYDFVNDDTDPMDDNYHGTMVAGIIAADGIIKGVAPKASLLAYKVSDETDNAWISDTVAGIDRALDPDGTPATDDAADVICISLSWFGTPYDTISQAVDNAFTAGSLPVVAGGNNGPDIMTMRSPGTAYNALTVGASTKSDELADISSRGPVGFGHIKPELVAPGINISTTYLGNQYGFLTGTSAAGPHVVGAAALLKQLQPNWTAAQLRAAIVNNAVDIGKSVVEQGAGRLDVLAAARAGVLCTPDVLAFETDTGEFIDSSVSEKVVLNNTLSIIVNFNVEITTYYSADEELVELFTPAPVNNYVKPAQSNFAIPAQSTYELGFQLTLPVDAPQGYYWGRVRLLSANDNLTLPFGFRNLQLDEAKGEWVVSTDTTIANKRLLARNLTVTNNAKLTLTDVTLFILSLKDGLSLIDITAGSELVLSGCTIAGYNPSIFYNFSARGKITITGSSLSGMWGIYEAPFPGGINIYASGSEVSNSSVFRCYTNGVFLNSVDDVVVADNQLHHNGGEGVLVYDSTNIKIQRNNCFRNWWDGIGVTRSDGLISDNEVHFNSYDGIWVNASAPYILNNNITQSGFWMKHQDAAGIKFQRGSEAVLESNSFDSNKYYGFYINASQPTIKNTSISNSLNKDVYLIPHEGEYSGPVFINSTYSTIFFQPSDLVSNITRAWFLDVSVRDETGEPVPDASVRVIDSREEQTALAMTGSDGRTPKLVATKYIRSSQKTEHRTPYRLEINRSIVTIYNYSDIQLDESSIINAILPVPDLLIERVAHSPATVFVNELTRFSVFIKNNGSIWLSDLRLSSYRVGNSTAFAEIPIASLGPGVTKNVSVGIKTSEEGINNYTFVVTSVLDLFERDMDNNQLGYGVHAHIRPGDLGLVIEESHTYVHEYITFNASASAGEEEITGYQFTFSDGTTTEWVTNSSYRHFFGIGNYLNVSFRVRTGSGLISNWSEPVWFQLIERLPTSGIDIDPLHGGNVKSFYRFTPTFDLDDISDIISSYHWTFGDGGFDENRTPRHEYIDDGVYNVTLKIRYTTDGSTFLFWKKLVVANIAPQASFFASSTQILLGEEVKFDAATSLDVDDTKEELSYHWDLGDGTEATGMVVTHTYTVDDVFFIVLTVTDDDLASSQHIVEVVVTDTGKSGDGASDTGLSGAALAIAIVVILMVVLIIVTLMLIMIRKKKPLDEPLDDELEEE